MIPYTALKLAHVFFVIVSGTLFCVRFLCLQRYPDRPLGRALRVLPHVNDTLLLVSAIGMLMSINANPMQIPWLMSKLILLLAYIGVGAACLRSAAGSRRQRTLFVTALALLGSIVAIALTKQPFAGL